jgi:hypothetical protein
MRHLGTALMAIGLALASLAAGFVVFMVSTISLTALLPEAAAEPSSAAAVVRDLAAYAAWAVTAVVVFVFGWRRLADAG